MNNLIYYSHEQLREVIKDKEKAINFKDVIIDQIMVENKYLTRDRDYYKDIVIADNDNKNKDDWGI